MHVSRYSAPRDERDAGNVDREVEEKIAPAEQGFENRAMIFARERSDLKLYAVTLGFRTAAFIAGDDTDALARHVDVPQQQRQSALPDGSAPDQNQPAAEFDVLRSFHFINCLLRSGDGASLPYGAASVRQRQRMQRQRLRQ
jgi:hypothetical protein